MDAAFPVPPGRAGMAAAAAVEEAAHEAAEAEDTDAAKFSDSSASGSIQLITTSPAGIGLPRPGFFCFLSVPFLEAIA